MLILIDFYAENPIVGKTLQSCYLENSNVYDDINGNGDSDWTIFNTPELLVSSPKLKLYGSTIDINWEYATIPGPIYSASSVRISGSSIKLGNPANLMGNRIELYSIGQLYIPGGSNGQVIMTDGSGALSFQDLPTPPPPPTPTPGLLVTNFVFNEEPTGAIDGVNKVYTTLYTPQPNTTTQVFVNGLLQRRDVLGDYTMNLNTITFNTPLLVGDYLVVNYIK